MPPIPILVALADPTRCRIIELLRDGPQPVHALAGNFDISRPAISRHLRVLKEAKLIGEKKVGRENRYGLNAGRLKPVREWLEDFAKAAPPARPAGKTTRAPKVVAHVPAPPQEPAAARPPAAKPLAQMGFDF